jgi:hypothetical protein
MDWSDLLAAGLGGLFLGIGLTVGAGAWRVIRRRYMENERDSER